VHLKSLTLRGFKSFASSTALRFEPGITCVVGPNGSGKSNVVDALAWVMGEQGAKSLRGGKMEDVIFAGTSGRPPLGRAEVLVTIDNSDGALPIAYAEVTISRIMFRNGGSEYAINGEPCRLLDVQELLSDSGIGREMHVIVGQGQLDAVLSASPEERRGFIEEAAGVLKHRKRKEKALRKLESMGANLTRLQDLTTELRRQLKPLGRQVEVARRAAMIQADLRDSRLRLLADDLLAFRQTLEAEIADERALRERRTSVEQEATQLREREAALEAAVTAEAPLLAAAQETYFRLASLRERLHGTAALAAERGRRLVDEPEQERRGQQPDELTAEAAAVRAEEAALVITVQADAERLQAAEQARAHAEQALAAEEHRVAAQRRAEADRREGLARLAGDEQAARSRVETRAAEIDRLRTGLGQARGRREEAQQAFTGLENQVAGLDEGEVDLDAEHGTAAGTLEAAEADVATLLEALAVAERERAASQARVEALRTGLAPKDGAAALLAASPAVSGLLGSVAALVTVRPGWETALATALGTAADAVAVRDLDSAVTALDLLRTSDGGRVQLILGDAAGGQPDVSMALPDGALAAIDLVTAPDELRPALAELLAGLVVVADLAAARDVVTRRPDLTAVTRTGDLLGRHAARGGSAATPSLLEVQAAVDEATDRLGAASHRVERARFELVAAQERQREAQQRVDAALARLHESDARLAAVEEQLAHLGATVRASGGEAERLVAALAAAEEAIRADEERLAELTERLLTARAEPVEGDERDDRESLAADVTRARQRELDVRLAVRTGEERVRALGGRAVQLEQAAEAAREAIARAAASREQAAREAKVAAAVLIGARTALTQLEESLEAAAEERSTTERDTAARAEELHALRARARELGSELERLTDSVHRDEVARAEQRLRIEVLETRAVEELGVDPETLLAEYGPDQPVPSAQPPVPVADPDVEVLETAETSTPEDIEIPAPKPYVRAEQEKRMRAAERDLAVLGKVNPLALEEFAALEERHVFLTEQLEDLRKTRRDLLDIIREVDERVEQVFTAAWEDTAREFEGVFARLFPGGEGRLVLTDPSDLLTTGIDVEARPPGKKVKRLSLLSGGERSLTAIALLVAIFKARPSPFYVLDEVEAALDDTNLGRLLGILEELRESSQLIVVTHQKRTMEIADALYGVSMKGDGVSEVISHRMREPEPV
jgi:chromosome segregation protein